jgi:hypothetical protein
MTRVCDPKLNIVILLFKYGELKPGVNCSKLHWNSTTPTSRQTGISATAVLCAVTWNGLSDADCQIKIVPVYVLCIVEQCTSAVHNPSVCNFLTFIYFSSNVLFQNSLLCLYTVHMACTLHTLLVHCTYCLYTVHIACTLYTLLVHCTHCLYTARIACTLYTLLVHCTHWLYTVHIACTLYTLIVHCTHWLYTVHFACTRHTLNFDLLFLEILGVNVKQNAFTAVLIIYWDNHTLIFSPRTLLMNLYICVLRSMHGVTKGQNRTVLLQILIHST